MGSTECETVGFIDVGTNSIHLLVVRFYPESMGTPVFQDKESIRLGQSLYSTGSISQEAVDKAGLVVARFAHISRELGADNVLVYATCAAREASNRRELVERMSAGAEVKVIPGVEEARLIGLGVLGQHPVGRNLVIDIGGGSTEVILNHDGENVYIDSLRMGAVRYAYGLGIDCSQPVSDRDFNSILRSVDASSYHAVNGVRGHGFDEATGSSGTMIALAEMCAARRGDNDASYMLLDELRQILADVRAMDQQQRAFVPGLGKSRTDIIVTGGAIAQELMELFGIQRIRISTRGLKQGMQTDYLISQGNTVYDTRDSSVRALAHRCNYDRKHSDAVERYCMMLFDQSYELGMHSMKGNMRNLLSSAAILHDIGEHISYTDHNLISQMIIEHAGLVGFDMNEVRMMGLMVRFHHKKFPGPRDSRLADLSPLQATEVRKCAMFLKMADVLDRHRTSMISDIRLTRSAGILMLELSSEDEPSMEMWRLDKLKPDFEKLFGLRLTAVWKHRCPRDNLFYKDNNTELLS